MLNELIELILVLDHPGPLQHRVAICFLFHLRLPQNIRIFLFFLVGQQLYGEVFDVAFDVAINVRHPVLVVLIGRCLTFDCLNRFLPLSVKFVQHLILYPYHVIIDEPLLVVSVLFGLQLLLHHNLPHALLLALLLLLVLLAVLVDLVDVRH